MTGILPIMDTLTTISLSDNWRIAYFGVDGWSPGFVPLDTLKDWTSPEQKSGGGITFMRQFSLEATDFCVRYLLHVETTPSAVKVLINGKTLPYEGTQPFIFDVTNVVQLEDNLIFFEVISGATGKFGAVYLEPVPCE